MKYEADYQKFSGILTDIVEFIKSFTEGLKKFINGFKTSYKYGEEE
jgi:hypothetical protein